MVIEPVIAFGFCLSFQPQSLIISLQRAIIQPVIAFDFCLSCQSQSLNCLCQTFSLLPLDQRFILGHPTLITIEHISYSLASIPIQMSHPSGASAGSEEGDLNWDLPPTAGGGIPGEAVSEEGQQYIELPPVTPNDFDSQASPPCGSPCSVHSDCGAEYLPPLPPLTIANLNLNDLAAELGEPGLFGGTGTGLDNPAVMDALPSPGTSLISPGHDIPDEISLFPGDPAPSFERPHWSKERTTCKHLDGFEERALVKEHALLDNFRKWGSEVCLKMWNRHHPFCRTLLITENGRESIERDAWNRSYIKHRNTKFKNE